MAALKRFQIVISPEEKISAAFLKAKVSSFGVKVIENCLGVEISGPQEEIEKTVAALRKNIGDKIFIRPLEANRGEDPLFRGYLQTDTEYRYLPLINPALQGKSNSISPLSGENKQKGLKKALVSSTADPERTNFLPAVITSPQRLEEPFFICRDAKTKEIISIAGSRSAALKLARQKGYTLFEDAREEAGEKWRNRALAAKMTRCLFARKNFAKEVDLSLILYNDRLIVRCPLIHVCGPIWWEKRCPYGELDDGFFSAKADEVYLRESPEVVDFFKLVPDRRGQFLTKTT